jgi:hypothetical protein
MVHDNVRESYFWQQVKAGLGSVPNVHMSRVENTAGSGISDVNVCVDGKEFWLELKMFHGEKLHFRTSQRAWISKHVACGGSVFILARKEDTLILYKACTCLEAPHKVSKDCKSFTVDYANLPTALYSCSKPFRWKEVLSSLIRS